MRSKLFVPGSRPALFPKAYASPADAISIDLEDAVDPARKAEAREHVRQWLDGLAQNVERRSGKLTIVRVNAQDTPYFAADIKAVVREGVDLINLPKPASTDAVVRACAVIAQAEQAQGLQKPVGVLLNIETPDALRNAARLADAGGSRVAGLQVGLGDLFGATGIDRAARCALEQVLFQVRMAASVAGVDAYDGAYADIGNPEGFRAEAELARSLGFRGKTCIHPSQIALANAVFLPSSEQIAAAQRIVQASERAATQGVGAYVVDGRMVDAPFLAQAKALLETARNLGLLAAE
ncbi:CoA ester lyase [Verticiella sediminum]|uniref:CoA ester lyase n=1 Tax=Verticiella sediminum TaxID=1247510 RepID=A0A556AW13_9BURK|nr:CoA ester lyase [Verticiella sediminum]TSH97117.1 CoA ester lyase [Verticiella sediminum]